MFMRLALAVAVIAVVLLAGDRSEHKKIEQRVYVPRCTGSWYINTQGTQGESDWVELNCSDEPSASDAP